MRVTWAALLAVFTVSFFTSVVAQDPPRIWNGVYTSAQAERGATVFQSHCSECHHEDLSGGEGPALVGNSFMVKWEMSSVERLFHKIRDTMPEVGSGNVTDAQKLDVVAFILQQNGYPAGELQTISISEKGRIVGSYSNGRTIDLAEITLANFTGADFLKRIDGGAFEVTDESGTPTYGASGTIIGSSLEGSNSDIADEFTKLIVTQQAYSANTRVISTANDMTQELLNMLR